MIFDQSGGPCPPDPLRGDPIAPVCVYSRGPCPPDTLRGDPYAPLRRTMRRSAWMMLAALLGFQLAVAAQQPAAVAQSAEFFETKVRPTLAANCYDCHTDQRNGGLRLDSREAMLTGGRTGPAIVPGDPDKSL